MDSRIKKHPWGYWEVTEKPTLDDLQRYYEDKYFQEGRGSYELEYTDEELQYFRAKIEQRLAVINHNKPHLSKGGTMLDVGCGEGYALSLFRENGWSVKGFDFSAANDFAKST